MKSDFDEDFDEYISRSWYPSLSWLVYGKKYWGVKPEV